MEKKKSGAGAKINIYTYDFLANIFFFPPQNFTKISLTHSYTHLKVHTPEEGVKSQLLVSLPPPFPTSNLLVHSVQKWTLNLFTAKLTLAT